MPVRPALQDLDPNQRRITPKPGRRRFPVQSNTLNAWLETSTKLPLQDVDAKRSNVDSAVARTVEPWSNQSVAAPRPSVNVQNTHGWTSEKADNLLAWIIQRAAAEPADRFESSNCDYVSFRERHNDDFCISLAREQFAEGFRVLESPAGIHDPEMLKTLPYDDFCHDKGWYLLLILDKSSIDWYKTYVGQAQEGFYKRESQHRRSVRNRRLDADAKVQLVHRIWAGGESRYGEFRRIGKAVRVASFDDNDVRCWYNLMEQYWATAFQTIPSLLLNKDEKSRSWTPEWYRDECEGLEQRGLNVQLPIFSGTMSGAKAYGLASHRDPEIAQAYRDKNREQLASAATKAIISGRETHFQGLRASKVKNAKHNGVLWREADETLGDRKSMDVVCIRCGTWEYTDKVPIYSLGEIGSVYVVRRWNLCPNCALPSGKFRSTDFIPKDHYPSLRYSTVKRRQAKKSSHQAVEADEDDG